MRCHLDALSEVKLLNLGRSPYEVAIDCCILLQKMLLSPVGKAAVLLGLPLFLVQMNVLGAQAVDRIYRKPCSWLPLSNGLELFHHVHVFRILVASSNAT